MYVLQFMERVWDLAVRLKPWCMKDPAALIYIKGRRRLPYRTVPFSFLFLRPKLGPFTNRDSTPALIPAVIIYGTVLSDGFIITVLSIDKG